MLRLGAVSLACLPLLALGCDPNTTTDNSAPPTQTPIATRANPEAKAPKNSDVAKAPVAKPAAEAEAEAVAAPKVEADPLGPLVAEQSAIFLAGAEDGGEPLPDHYVKSNEVRHDTWFPYVTDLGGAFVGVGPDQCYTVAAAQKAELAFLLDIDHMVIEVHHNYEVLIKASKTPEELRQRFNKTQRDASVALLEAAYAGDDGKIRRHHIQTYKASRETIFRHLGHVIKRHQGEVMTSWLSNPEYYAHIRKMYQNDRVRIMDGDLTGSETMKSVGAAATKLNVPVRVLYLSNAEEYYKYTRQYAANISGLPAEATSVTLRTIYNKEWEHADSLWNYQVQPLTSYQEFLENPAIRSRNSMFRAATKKKQLKRTTDVKGVSHLAMPAAVDNKQP